MTEINEIKLPLSDEDAKKLEQALSQEATATEVDTETRAEPQQ